MSPKAKDSDGQVADPVVCRMAYTCATRIGEELEKYSRIIDPKAEEGIPRFDRDEIVLGDLLGSGGFNNVFEIKRVKLISGTNMEFTEDQQGNRQYLAKRASRNRYAVKFLNKEVMNHPEDYCNGAADLMIETKLLASLKPHPNIIRLRGLAAAGAQGFAHGVVGGYFLIVDRLYDTLDRRIDAWRERSDAITQSGESDVTTRLLNKMFLERLRVSYDLCSALRHLHKLSIVFRDMKPDNVGFDARGYVKLFDFGLAKELNPDELTTNEMYDMSGQTGSRRYMAPEVALCEPYGLSADTYSFGVMMWQIFAMREPYRGMTKNDHLELIVRGNGRPKLDESWSKHLCNVLKWSWLRDPCLRPPMKEIARALKHEICKQRKLDGNEDSDPIPQDRSLSPAKYRRSLSPAKFRRSHSAAKYNRKLPKGRPGVSFDDRLMDVIKPTTGVAVHA